VTHDLTPESGRVPRAGRVSKRALVASVVVVALSVGILSRMADLSTVWERVAGIDVTELLVLGAVAIASLLAYGLVLMSVMPGLRFSQATVVSQSSTAVANTVPAGGAVGIGVSYRFYTSWGFTPAAVGRNVVVTGVWNLLAKMVLPVVALVIIVAGGGSHGGLLAAALVGVLALVVIVAGGAVVLSSEAGARRLGSWIGRVGERVLRIARRPGLGDVGAAAVRLRRDTIDLLRRRGVRLSAAMLASHLSVFAVLLFSLRATGVTSAHVGPAEILASFALVRLASAVPVMPGGAGVVETGLAGALIAAGGQHSAVVAGVLVFRALTYLLPIPVGIATYVVWRTRTSWHRSVPAATAPV
jgi:uncharacterized membrane protein YbhN (UPF0104 family)